jgi:hypothetical protein
MKRNVLVFFLFSTLIIAQTTTIDSTSNKAVDKDSVNIRELVQAQIQNAIEKQTAASKVSGSSTKTESVDSSTPQEEQIASHGLILGVIINQPLHMKIFEISSFLIITVLLSVRLVGAIQKKSLHVLKEKIAMLRNEKIIYKQDPKLQVIRKQLPNKDSIFNKSDKHISKAAKELKISKGELLLAARLRLFEVGKM